MSKGEIAQDVIKVWVVGVDPYVQIPVNVKSFDANKTSEVNINRVASGLKLPVEIDSRSVLSVRLEEIRSFILPIPVKVND